MPVHWLLVTGGIAVFNTIFLGVLLLAKNRSAKNRLLGCLFIALGLRTGKSIVIILVPAAPDSVPAVGLVGMAVIGPLYYYYLRAVTNDPDWQRRIGYHCVWPVLTSLLLLINTETVVYWLYVSTSAQLLLYLLYAVSTCWSGITSKAREDCRWQKLLLGSLCFHWGVYTLQIFDETRLAYITSTVLVALLLYVLLFYFFRWQKVFGYTKPVAPYANKEKLQAKLLTLMADEKLYTQPGLTLSVVATRLEVKPYVVSGMINRHFQQTFPEFVNRYRVDEAKQLLLTADLTLHTIEGVGYACGYNTPSAFYASFKNATKLTPTQYREKYESKP